MKDEVVVTVIATGFASDPLANIKSTFDEDDEPDDSFAPEKEKKTKKDKKNKKDKSDGLNVPSWLKK